MHDHVAPGDGIIAVFASTVDAILGAQELMATTEATGLQTRTGLRVADHPTSRAAIADADRVCRCAADGESAPSAAVLDAVPALSATTTASTGVDLSAGSTSVHLLRGFAPLEHSG